MIFIDTETCGLYGLPVLIQYAYDDGPVWLHCPWTVEVRETLRLIRKFMEEDLVFFNAAFDMFHLCKLYTIFDLVQDKDSLPNIQEIYELEPEGRNGPCLKPRRCCDIMLVARKGKYQSTMDRGDIRIRKVPRQLAFELAGYLEDKVKLDSIYFARRKDQNAARWKVFDRDDSETFKDVVLGFRASSSLKNLAIHALGRDVIKYAEATMQLESTSYPEELGYAPFAKALPRTAKRWPDVIRRHIAYWHDNPLARKYAEEDVIHTRDLWKHLGSPEPGDDDSELACMVAAVRWKGFAIDLEGIKELKEKAEVVAKSAPKAPGPVKYYIGATMNEVERMFLNLGTKKIILEEIANSEEWEDHPAQERAKNVLAARLAKSERDLYTKLITAGRFHASFNVIGTLSSRMAGADGLNPQGIKRARHVREKFLLHDPASILCGGDFQSFEVSIAAAAYPDPKLIADLQQGKSIHAVFGMCVYPRMSYEEIINHKEIYNKCKSALFALLYGGQAYTLMTRLGTNIEIAENAYTRFLNLYPVVAVERENIFNKFKAMRQDGGLGSRIEWHDPEDYIESMLGFRRHFTLENEILRHLYEVANSPPKDWRKIKGVVNRRDDREQSIGGATQTSLYAAGFALQGANMRAAGNHVIQSTGAQITKAVQRAIWDVQPSGIHSWVVQPMNIHDEIMCPTDPDKASDVESVVQNTVDSYRDRIPLLGIDWRTNLDSWADK